MPPKKQKNNKINNTSDTDHTDKSDDVSDVSSDEMSDETISKKAKEAYMKDEFLEKIVKYIKTDDLIRQETLEFKEKINTLKEEKSEIETFILRYLDHADEDIINIAGNGKLSKQESIRKGGLNKDIIKQSIFEQLKKENIIKDEKKGKELAENTYNLMEGKREKKTKVYLKRTFERKKKEKVKKNTKDNEDKEIEKKPKKKNTKQ